MSSNAWIRVFLLCFVALLSTLDVLALQYVSVSPSTGNNANCQVIPIQILATSSYTPCRSLTYAINLIQTNLTTPDDVWLHVLPGIHFSGELTLANPNVLRLNISSNYPPQTPIAAQLPLSGASIWDCDTFKYCFQSTSLPLAVDSLYFQNSLSHSFIQMGSSLSISNCTFNATGGAVYKLGGTSFEVANTILSNSAAANNTVALNLGLFHVEDVIYFHMVGCTVRNNVLNSTWFPSELNIASPVLVKSSTIPIEALVESSLFIGNRLQGFRGNNNEGRAGGAVRFVGLTSLKATVSNCTFTQNEHVISQLHGLGIALKYNATNSATQVSLDIIGCSLFNNTVPHYAQALNEGSVYGVVYAGPLFDDAYYMGARVRFLNSTCSQNSARTGGCVHFDTLQSLLIDNVSFINNTASDLAGALYVSNETPETTFFFPDSLVISNSVFSGNNVWTLEAGGGAAMFDILLSQLEIRGCLFEKSINAYATGGAIRIQSTRLRSVLIQDSVFRQNVGFLGAGIWLTYVKAKIDGCTFEDNTAAMGGGGLFLSAGADASVSDSTFNRNRVFGDILTSTTYSLNSVLAYSAGSAIGCFSSTLLLYSNQFDSNAILPSSGSVDDCRTYLDTSSGRMLDFVGTVALFSSSLNAVFNTFTNNVACSAAGISVFSQATANIRYNDFLGSTAYFASTIHLDSCNDPVISGNTFTDCTAQVGAGAIALVNMRDLFLNDCTFTRVLTLIGNGGCIWSTRLDGPSTSIVSNTFDCSAVFGAGGVLFVYIPPAAASTQQNTSIAVPQLDFDDPDLKNTVVPRNDSAAVFGPVVASSILAIRSSNDRIFMYPGESFFMSEFSLYIYGRDAYDQSITAPDVVAQLNPLTDFYSGISSITGTSLVRFSADGYAAYTDLAFYGKPGTYNLTFSIVGQPYISIDITLIMQDFCPLGQHYSPIVGGCQSCAVENLPVWNETEGVCEPCPAHFQAKRIADLVQCEACSLGSTSVPGSSCTRCPSLSFQSIRGTDCQSCLDPDMIGLSCDTEHITVQPGYFPYSVIGDSGVPTIRTVQCPDGYCAGGLVQEFNSSSTTSAITRFDFCAFPRKSSADNLLCGECEVGYLAWGSSCYECDKVNGGLTFLLFSLSVLLICFLIRASSMQSSAGHGVVVLYFLQTAILEVGTSATSNLLRFVNIVLFDSNTTNSCIGPLDVYAQATFQIIMPLLLFGELCVIGLLHWLLSKLLANHSDRHELDWSSLGVCKQMRVRFVQFMQAFSVDLYISATLSLLLFSYTQVTLACLRYLSCVDVAGTSVVFAQPSMRCDSPVYRRYLVLVILALIFYVALFPVGLLAFLWHRHDLIVLAHAHLKSLEGRSNDSTTSSPSGSRRSSPTHSRNPSGVIAHHASMSEPSAPASPSSAAAAANGHEHSQTSAATLLFLTRYSTLFSMYSSRAWFWNVMVLARRCVFAALSVFLIRKPAIQFLGYSLAHLFSLLLQIFFKPFQVDWFNWAEYISHLILIVLSQYLTAVLPPLGTASQLFLFFLIIPPVLIYAVLAVFRKARTIRSDFIRKKASKRGGGSHNGNGASSSSNGVELQPVASSPRSLAYSMSHQGQTQVHPQRASAPASPRHVDVGNHSSEEQHDSLALATPSHQHHNHHALEFNEIHATVVPASMLQSDSEQL